MAAEGTMASRGKMAAGGATGAGVHGAVVQARQLAVRAVTGAVRTKREGEGQWA